MMHTETTSGLSVPTHFAKKFLIVGVPKDILKTSPERYPRIPIELIEEGDEVKVEIKNPHPVGIYLYGCFSWQPYELEKSQSTEPITSLRLNKGANIATVMYSDRKFEPPSYEVGAYDVQTGEFVTTSLQKQLAAGINTLALRSNPSTEAQPLSGESQPN